MALRHTCDPDEFLHAGAILALSEAHRYLRVGTYTVQGRRGVESVQELRLRVRPGKAEYLAPVAPLALGGR